MKATKEQAATWFETMHPPGPAARDMALSALRGPTREIVEKMPDGRYKRKGVE